MLPSRFPLYFLVRVRMSLAQTFVGNIVNCGSGYTSAVPAFCTASGLLSFYTPLTTPTSSQLRLSISVSVSNPVGADTPSLLGKL